MTPVDPEKVCSRSIVIFSQSGFLPLFFGLVFVQLQKNSNRPRSGVAICEEFTRGAKPGTPRDRPQPCPFPSATRDSYPGGRRSARPARSAPPESALKFSRGPQSELSSGSRFFPGNTEKIRKTSPPPGKTGAGPGRLLFLVGPARERQPRPRQEPAPRACAPTKYHTPERPGPWWEPVSARRPSSGPRVPGSTGPRENLAGLRGKREPSRRQHAGRPPPISPRMVFFFDEPRRPKTGVNEFFFFWQHPGTEPPDLRAPARFSVLSPPAPKRPAPEPSAGQQAPRVGRKFVPPAWEPGRSSKQPRRFARSREAPRPETKQAPAVTPPQPPQPSLDPVIAAPAEKN